MWNFNYVIPTLLVLVVFMGYYYGLPRIPISISRYFVKLVAIEFVVMATDIVSTLACINYEILPIWLIYLLNEAYFVTFCFRAFMFFLLTAIILKSSASTGPVKRMISYIPAIILSLVVISAPWTHWFFYIDGSGYHSGKLYNLLYTLFLAYMAGSFILIVKHRVRIRRRREFASVVWYNIILLLGIFIRYAFPKYLLMDTFCLLALIVIYLSFVNPDFFLEPRTWIFNSRALREYIGEINNKKKFTVLELVIDNYFDFRDLYGARQMDQGIDLIGSYLEETFKNVMVFYDSNGRFSILSENDFDYVSIYSSIKERFKHKWNTDDAELYLDVCGAIIHFGDRRISFENVISILSSGYDSAAKSDGDELIVMSSDEQIKITEMSEIKKILKYSIEHDKVKVFLQPIINSKTGKLEGAEALARLVDINGNIIRPDLFIPIAEKNGMINQLGNIVFEKTCKFIRDTNVDAMGLSWINVNLSPIQFMRSDIADRLVSYIKEYHIKPESIHLEITEETMVDEALLMKQMESLMAKGFSFALDDYGKGYSNIARLKKCPFINIKLDMSIVCDYCSKPDALIPNVVETFQKLGFSITAEGIENEQMAKSMTDIGVTFLQGYHFSRPIPMEEFVKIYSK